MGLELKGNEQLDPKVSILTCCCVRQSGGRYYQLICLHISEVGESVLYCNLVCADKGHH
jgi:hypothetical protein